MSFWESVSPTWADAVSSINTIIGSPAHPSPSVASAGNTSTNVAADTSTISIPLASDVGMVAMTTANPNSSSPPSASKVWESFSSSILDVWNSTPTKLNSLVINNTIQLKTQDVHQQQVSMAQEHDAIAARKIATPTPSTHFHQEIPSETVSISRSGVDATSRFAINTQEASTQQNKESILPHQEDTSEVPSTQSPLTKRTKLYAISGNPDSVDTDPADAAIQDQLQLGDPSISTPSIDEWNKDWEPSSTLHIADDSLELLPSDTPSQTTDNPIQDRGKIDKRPVESNRPIDNTSTSSNTPDSESDTSTPNSDQPEIETRLQLANSKVAALTMLLSARDQTIQEQASKVAKLEYELSISRNSSNQSGPRPPTSPSIEDITAEFSERIATLESKYLLCQSDLSKLRTKERTLEEENKLLKFEGEKLREENQKLIKVEKTMAMAVENQKDYSELTTQQIESLKSKVSTQEGALERANLELASTWRKLDLLKKDFEAAQQKHELELLQTETTLKAAHEADQQRLKSKYEEKLVVMQTTVQDLTSTLESFSERTTEREEALSARVAELELNLCQMQTSIVQAETVSHHSTSPLLRQIADLNAQLTTQQRVVENLDVGWKERLRQLQDLLSDAESTRDATLNQLRTIDAQHAKLQSQFSKLEQQLATAKLQNQELESDLELEKRRCESLQASEAAACSKEDKLKRKFNDLKTSFQAMQAEHDEKQNHAEEVISGLKQRISHMSSYDRPFSPSHSSSDLDPTSRNLAFSLPAPVELKSTIPPSIILSSPASHKSIQMENQALNTQVSTLRNDKSRLEVLLANAMLSVNEVDQLNAQIATLRNEKDDLNERYQAALEMLGEQSERLQYVDEEISETKQLYQSQVGALAEQLAAANASIVKLSSKSPTA